MSNENSITLDALKRAVSYNPEVGVFYWKHARGRVSAGAVAGHIGHDHRRRLTIDKKHILASRAAWLYMTGAFPAGEIDHKNGNKLDDRICNLRDVTRALNQQNLRSANRRSTSGLLGVLSSRSRFRARIHIDGRDVGLGTFDTAQEAHEAYLHAKRKIHLACTI